MTTKSTSLVVSDSEQPISISSCLILLLLGWGGRMSWAEESWHKKKSGLKVQREPESQQCVVSLLCATLAAFIFHSICTLNATTTREEAFKLVTNYISLFCSSKTIAHTLLCSLLPLLATNISVLLQKEFFATLRRFRQCSLSSNSSF